MLERLKAWLAVRLAAHVIKRTPGAEKLMLEKLKGWRTYIAAAGAIAAGLAGLASGNVTLEQFLHGAEIAGLLATLRHAIAARLGTDTFRFLNGFKTYLVGVASVAAAAVAYADGKLGIVALIQAAVTAAVAAFARAGVSEQ